MDNYKKYNSGFTLIEIMVTVAIVAIFATIALPSFSKLIERNKISTGTNELLSNLLLTRSEALKRSNSVTLCSSTDQETCNGPDDYSSGWIIFLDCVTAAPANGLGNRSKGAVADCGPNGREDIIKVHDGVESLFMKNNVGDAVTFKYTGRPVAISTFSIGTDKAPTVNKSTLSIGLVGRVRVE